MISPIDMTFRRKYSVNLYKNLRFPLGEMSLYSNWLYSDRGDPYPLLAKLGEAREEITREGFYKVQCATDGKTAVKRLLGQHFPYANYEMTIEELNGSVGFSFSCHADDRNVYTEETAPTVDILFYGNENGCRVLCKTIVNGETVRTENTERFAEITVGTTVSVACRGEEFDIFSDNCDTPKVLHTFTVPEFNDIRRQVNFTVCTAALYVHLPESDCIASVSGINWFLDCGVCQADMRPIRYIDGTPMTEDGRIFFTMSSRLVKGAYQSVISWNPTSCDFKLEGAMFFDAGDGVWCADVASSVLYDKENDKFLIWMCSFSHDHILAHGISYADVRYGINVIDVELMEIETLIPQKSEDGTNPGGVPQKGRAILEDDTAFKGKYGDEDPDFYYDSKNNCWYMTVCRGSNKTGKYEYFRFKSDDPFKGYTFIDRTGNEQETGGSTVKIGDKRYFFCGAHFEKRACYNTYEIGDDEKFRFLGNIKTDYDDGGFRGWGTIVPVKCGSRTKYMWMTFDRFLGSSSYNWSYGNIYVFEADVEGR